MTDTAKLGIYIGNEKIAAVLLLNGELKVVRLTQKENEILALRTYDQESEKYIYGNKYAKGLSQRYILASLIPEIKKGKNCSKEFMHRCKLFYSGFIELIKNKAIEQFCVEKMEPIITAPFVNGNEDLKYFFIDPASECKFEVVDFIDEPEAALYSHYEYLEITQTPEVILIYFGDEWVNILNVNINNKSIKITSNTTNGIEYRSAGRHIGGNNNHPALQSFRNKLLTTLNTLAEDFKSKSVIFISSTETEVINLKRLIEAEIKNICDTAQIETKTIGSVVDIAKGIMYSKHPDILRPQSTLGSKPENSPAMLDELKATDQAQEPEDTCEINSGSIINFRSIDLKNPTLISAGGSPGYLDHSYIFARPTNTAIEPQAIINSVSPVSPVSNITLEPEAHTPVLNIQAARIVSETPAAPAPKPVISTPMPEPVAPAPVISEVPVTPEIPTSKPVRPDSSKPVGRQPKAVPPVITEPVIPAAENTVEQPVFSKEEVADFCRYLFTLLASRSATYSSNFQKGKFTDWSNNSRQLLAFIGKLKSDTAIRARVQEDIQIQEAVGSIKILLGAVSQSGELHDYCEAQVPGISAYLKSLLPAWKGDANQVYLACDSIWLFHLAGFEKLADKLREFTQQQVENKEVENPPAPVKPDGSKPVGRPPKAVPPVITEPVIPAAENTVQQPAFSKEEVVDFCRYLFTLAMSRRLKYSDRFMSDEYRTMASKAAPIIDAIGRKRAVMAINSSLSKGYILREAGKNIQSIFNALPKYPEVVTDCEATLPNSAKYFSLLGDVWEGDLHAEKAVLDLAPMFADATITRMLGVLHPAVDTDIAELTKPVKPVKPETTKPVLIRTDTPELIYARHMDFARYILTLFFAPEFNYKENFAKGTYSQWSLASGPLFAEIDRLGAKTTMQRWSKKLTDDLVKRQVPLADNQDLIGSIIETLLKPQALALFKSVVPNSDKFYKDIYAAWFEADEAATKRVFRYAKTLAKDDETVQRMLTMHPSKP